MSGLAQGVEEDYSSQDLRSKIFVVVQDGVVTETFGGNAEVIDLDDAESDPIRLWEDLSDEAKVFLERTYPVEFADLRTAYNEAIRHDQA